MKLYTFRTVRMSIIRTLFTVHSAVLYIIQFCRQLSSRTNILVLLESCLQTCLTYIIAECTVNKMLRHSFEQRKISYEIATKKKKCITFNK
jgi:hypothetical protein